MQEKHGGGDKKYLQKQYIRAENNNHKKVYHTIVL